MIDSPFGETQQDYIFFLKRAWDYRFEMCEMPN